jgi:hypothetical protein
MRDKLIKIFTRLTLIFVVLAFVEMFVGLYAQDNFENYHGSFYDVYLPYIFIGTGLLSIFSNISILLIKYVSNENN